MSIIFFYQGHIPFLEDVRQKFISGSFCPLLRNICPWGITHNILLWLVLVYATHESFFHQGQNYTILIFIRGLCPLCPTVLHASALMKKLNYQMFVRSYSYISFIQNVFKVAGCMNWSSQLKWNQHTATRLHKQLFKEIS